VKRLGLVALALVTSACGSTVAGSASSTSAAQGTNGLGGTGLGGASSITTTGGAAPLAGAPAVGAAAGQQGSVAAGAGTTSALGGPAVTGRSGTALQATYPGVTAKTISVAASVSSTGSGAGEQVGQAFGVAGFSSAPEKPLINAMVGYVNSHGGILGRKLVPVFHTVDNADTRPYAEQSQEACSTYTEDNKVFAHVNVVSDDTFFACMEKHKTVGIERRVVGSDVVTRSFPGIFTLSDVDYTTAMSLTVRDLVQEGFLTKSSVIGVLQTDTPDFDRVRKDGIERELARTGLHVAKTYRITPVQGTSDAATAVRDAQAAVLQFASAGVDRVLFAQPNGALFDIVFMKQAEQQGYRPKYGLSTHDGPVALGGGNAPAAQLDGSRGVGWGPYDDFSDVPKAQVSPDVAQCLAIYRQAGVSAPTDRGQLNEYLGYCASYQLFATIARAAGPDLTRTSFIAAGEQLGSHFDDPFAITGASMRSAGRHEGVTAWQPIAYNAGCDCYRPTGTVARLP
jgi:hypothetical protein